MPGGPSNYTVLAQILPFSIRSVTPAHVGNGASVTVTINGAKFHTDDTVRIESADGSVHLDALAVTAVSSAVKIARFNLEDTPLGVYSVVVRRSDGQTATCTDCLTIETSTGPQLRVDLQGLTVARTGSQVAYRALITNTGNVDVMQAAAQVTIPEGLQYNLTVPTSGASRDGVSTNDPLLLAGSFMPPGSEWPIDIKAAMPPERMQLAAGIVYATSSSLTGPQLVTDFGTTSNGCYEASTGQLDAAGLDIQPHCDYLRDLSIVTVRWFHDFLTRIDQPAFNEAEAATVCGAVSEWLESDPSVFAGMVILDDNQFLQEAVDNLEASLPEDLFERLQLVQAQYGSYTQWASLLQYWQCLNAIYQNQTSMLSCSGWQHTPSATIETIEIKSWDPNQMIGRTGYSDPSFVPRWGVLPYKILFENYKTASAPGAGQH